jgi:hypothetical protein
MARGQRRGSNTNVARYGIAMVSFKSNVDCGFGCILMLIT